MNKITKILFMSGLVLLFTGCGGNQGTQDTTKESTTEESVAVSRTNSTESASASFEGRLVEDAAKNDDQKSIRIVLSDVKGINDPEDMAKSFANDGVILNIAEDQLGNVSLEELKSGSQLRFTTMAQPIMTMSIPPQIPGNSIQKIELVK